MRAALLTRWRGPLAHALVDELIAVGTLPIALADDVEAARAALPPGVLVEREPAGFDDLRQLLAHVDAVVDNRVLPDGGRRIAALRQEYRKGTHDLVAAAFDARVSRVVWVRPLNALDGPHWATFRHAQEVYTTASLFGVPVTRVEVPQLFGPEAVATTPLNTFIERMARGRFPRPGLGAVDILFAGSAARAVVDAVRGAGPGDRVLTGLRRSQLELAELISAEAGADPITRLLVVLPARLTGWAEGVAPVRGELHEQVLRADIRLTVNHFRGGQGGS